MTSKNYNSKTVHNINNNNNNINNNNNNNQNSNNDNDNTLRSTSRHIRSKSSYDKSTTKKLRRPRSDYYPSSNIQESNKIIVTHFSDNDDSRSKPSKSYSRRLSFSGSPSPTSRFDSSKLYAGPTFNNSPDPSELPIPSFLGGKSLTKDLPLLSINNNSMSSTNNNKNTTTTTTTTTTISNNKKRHQLNAFTTTSKRQEYHTSAAAYMIPERMATSHHPSQVYSTVDELSLDDISKALKSILKISGQ